MTILTDHTSNIVVLKYPVDSRVWIEDAECWGRVSAIKWDGMRVVYEVSWFDDDKCVHEAWFRDTELKRSKSEV